jgi:hypothetical protein
MRGVRLSLALLLALPLVLSVTSAGSAVAGSPARFATVPGPVPSLEPAKTNALWTTLVSSPRRQLSAAAADCRPARVVFYTSSDWLRMATKLAAAASPCADYYLSIPPLTADKTLARPDQAWRIRALGPRFHAMAEIHFATWNRWVANTGNSWHAAGVTARQRMAAAGFDVAQGDSWAVNELSTGVRRGTGNARANIREFLRGLYEGDGTRPTRGAVFVIGHGQPNRDLSVYQSRLQHWLEDSPFWTDMATYVSDWSQEVYGDVRNHAVPGAPTPTRREYLNDYLQHMLVLAGAGPATIEPARSYLREAYSPLANAAWQWDRGYGWTMITPEQMAAYVSAQINAMRHFSAASGQARDHWGFAWSPRNATGVSERDFPAQTGSVIDRMAAAIRDSGEVVEPENPGSGACGPPGQDALCAADVPGAQHNDAWRSFRGWTDSALGFTTPRRTLAAGGPPAEIRLALVTTNGTRVTSAPPRLAALRTTSSQGTFATTPAGPWARTLAVDVAAPADAVVYYRDTRAGTHTITASAAGSFSGAQAVTVTPGPLARITVRPASGPVRARGKLTFVAVVTDVHRNPVRGSFRWRVLPARLGKVKRTAQGRALFTAERIVRRGLVVASATSGGRTITGSAKVAVRPSPLRIGSIAHRRTATGARVLLRAVDPARRPVSEAKVVAIVRQGGRPLARVRVATGRFGRADFRIAVLRGCITVTVARASAAGFVWDRRTPRNRFCA